MKAGGSKGVRDKEPKPHAENPQLRPPVPLPVTANSTAKPLRATKNPTVTSAIKNVSPNRRKKKDAYDILTISPVPPDTGLEPSSSVSPRPRSKKHQKLSRARKKPSWATDVGEGKEGKLITRTDEQVTLLTEDSSDMHKTFISEQITTKLAVRKFPSFSQNTMNQSKTPPLNPINSLASISSLQNESDDGSALSPHLELTRERVEKAIRKGRVFEIRGFVNEAVRETLFKRGWVEKRPNGNGPQKSASLSERRENYAQLSRSQSELMDSIAFARRMLNYQPANFIWVDYGSRVDWSTLFEWQIVNKHPQSCFVRKYKLVDLIQKMQWVANEPGTCITSFPRTYRLKNDEEKRAFSQDFKFTACLSLLRWFGNVVEASGKESVILGCSEAEATPSCPIFRLLDFALLQVQNYVRVRKHDDLDDEESATGGKSFNGGSTLAMTDWTSFLSQSYSLIRRDGDGAGGKDKVKFKFPLGEAEKASKMAREKYVSAKEVLQAVDPFWPQSRIDGTRNMWIFKPSNGQGGKGIYVLDNYHEIEEKFLKSHQNVLVQKYIERPFLVQHTKFDVRQWFMITSWNPLTAWFYKESYLRFSSKCFNLEDLDRRIHLTNRGVQEKYEIDPSRHPSLPSDNMWCSSTFQAYLGILGKGNMWKDVIYPEMKAAIRTVLLTVRESMVHRERSFMILGADFLLSEDLKPWLIEINSSPLLNNSSSVTTKLCPRCIQDTIKVVLDWKLKDDPNADTGDWELFAKLSEPFVVTADMDAPEAVVIQGDNSSLLCATNEIPAKHSSSD